MPEENKNLNNAEIDELKETLEAAERARDEYLAGWQRAKADFINYKQEERKHFDDAVKYGIEGIVRDLIDVLDSFDLAIRAMGISSSAPANVHDPQQNVGIGKGISLIRLQIESLLKKRGVEKIPIKPGNPFDPAAMEAIAEIESDKPAGTVMEEVEPGYRLYDKILRAARVIISKSHK